MDQQAKDKAEELKAKLSKVREELKLKPPKPLTSEEISAQIKRMPKGDYAVRRKQIVDKTYKGPAYNLTSEGGFRELIIEYILIMQKKSIASALHRQVIIEKIDVLREVTKSKAEWHRIVYPYDTSGEFTKILRHGYVW